MTQEIIQEICHWFQSDIICMNVYMTGYEASKGIISTIDFQDHQSRPQWANGCFVCFVYPNALIDFYTPPPPQTKFWGYIGITLPICLAVRLFVQSELNLGYTFWIKRDKAFILHMWIPCDKTFLSVTKILTLWPWPWLLTYFWSNVTFDITFEPKKIRLSYYIWGFLVTRPFCSYQKFWPCDFDLDFWPSFEQNLTLEITFEPKEIGLSYIILHMWVPSSSQATVFESRRRTQIPWLATMGFLVTRPFCPYQKTLTLWHWPWLLTYFCKNLTLVINFEP